MLLIWTCLVLSVIVDAHGFKRAPSSIVYWPFSDIHKNKMKKRLCNITSLTPKCSYSWFLKIRNIWITFLHGVWKNGRKFKIINLFLFEGNTQLLQLWYISLHPRLLLKIINFVWDCINVFPAWEIAWWPLCNCFRDVVSLWITWWTPSKKCEYPYFLIIHET
jgi:hypothetical protein